MFVACLTVSGIFFITFTVKWWTLRVERLISAPKARTFSRARRDTNKTQQRHARSIDSQYNKTKGKTNKRNKGTQISSSSSSSYTSAARSRSSGVLLSVHCVSLTGLVARRAGRASLCAVPRRHGALTVAPRSALELRLTVRRCNHMWLCPGCACGCVMITAPVAAPLNCAAQSAPVAALELRNQLLARRRGQHLIVHHHARLLVPARKPPAWRLAAISGAVCPAPLFRHCPRRSAATASW